MELFPIKVHPKEHQDSEIVQEIDDLISLLNETQDWASVSYMSPNAMQETIHGTHSKQHLLQLFKKHLMPKLTSFLGEEIEEYVKSIKQQIPNSESAYIEPLKGGWEISQSWINICPSGKKFERHTHAGQIISGVYYHKTRPEQGGILFYNPNPFAKMCLWGSEEEGIYFDPVPESVILFPSWLEHQTEPNGTDDPRYSIAFNVHLP